MLSLTEAGHAEPRQRLRHPADQTITAGSRFFTVLAFSPGCRTSADRHAVPRRRLASLEEPASFCYDGDRPARAEEAAAPTGTARSRTRPTLDRTDMHGGLRGPTLMSAA
ncbi:hypothetical protein [Streptomyces avermitilis]|uniref:hypothetical protein n=1 Tax=Streptomyces avermitilis TaxID=33903 RepID=UPI0038068195